MLAHAFEDWWSAMHQVLHAFHFLDSMLFSLFSWQYCFGHARMHLPCAVPVMLYAIMFPSLGLKIITS